MNLSVVSNAIKIPLQAQNRHGQMFSVLNVHTASKELKSEIEPRAEKLDEALSIASKGAT